MRIYRLCLLLLFSAISVPAFAAQTGDWPCIQVKVPELSLGAFWSGPPVDEAALKAWRENPEIAKLVAAVVSRRTPIEDAEKLAGDFAAARKDDKAGLTLAFAGAFSELNSLRTVIINGIERFTRNQRQLADATRNDRTELQQLLAAPEKTEEQRARIQELQTKIQWESRLHAERESSLRYVCETPVLLEQRLFAIARAIQNEM